MSLFFNRQANPLKQLTYQSWLLMGLVCFLFLVSCNKSSPANEGDIAANKAKIEVEEDGFYRISEKDLTDAELLFDTFSASSLRLTTQNEPVPFYFDEDALVFYGQAPTSRYAATRPYILSVGDDGVLMEETAVSSALSAANQIDTITRHLHLEENTLYESQTRSHNEDDVWFWETIRQGKSFPIPFELPVVADGSGNLTIQLVGVSYNPEVDDDHDVDILINGINLGPIQFDGATTHTGSLPIPPGTLKTGQNELIIDNTPEGAAFLDIMQLNWIDLAYKAPTTAVNDSLILGQTSGEVTLSGFSDTPLLFDITQPDAPRYVSDATPSKDPFQLTLAEDQKIAVIGPEGFNGSGAITPFRDSNWRDTNQQADLLIITTDELMPSLAALKEAREAEGLTVAIVPTNEIYDSFGGGEASPESLREFIKYTHTDWQDPKPRYLLLVGDATSDYQNYLDLAPRNIVPALMVPVSFSGETVSDSVLADVDGDGKPNMAVGRWPVNTPEEVESLVQRTLAYEQGTAVNKTYFAADGTESQFQHMAESIASNSLLPESGLHIATAPRADEVTAILNEGVWLATYVGHGSLRQWGKDDVFTQEAVANIDTDTPPIVVQLTCLTGLFTQPEQTSLTELLLTHETGPVLAVAATSLTLSSNQEPFATSLIQHLNDPTVERMGDAFQAAKLSLDIENEGLREISDTFALFGDPSAKIVRPNS